MNSSIEIRVVANGYWVSPGAYAYGERIDSSNVYVFQTFEALILWMKENLQEVKK